MKTTHSEAQQWWDNLSTGQRRLICVLARMVKGAKRSQIHEIIRATANWENGIGSFIKLRIIHQRPFRLAPKSPWLRVEGKAVPQAQTKPIAKSIPSQWSDGYIPRRRNLCRQKLRF